MVMSVFRCGLWESTDVADLSLYEKFAVSAHDMLVIVEKPRCTYKLGCCLSGT